MTIQTNLSPTTVLSQDGKTVHPGYSCFPELFYDASKSFESADEAYAHAKETISALNDLVQEQVATWKLTKHGAENVS